VPSTDCVKGRIVPFDGALWKGGVGSMLRRFLRSLTDFKSIKTVQYSEQKNEIIGNKFLNQKKFVFLQTEN